MSDKTEAEILEEVKAKLKSEGFGGLYCPGECACDLEDFAPCGTVEKDEDDDWLNGCCPGRKFCLSTDKNVWMISSKSSATDDEILQACGL